MTEKKQRLVAGENLSAQEMQDAWREAINIMMRLAHAEKSFNANVKHYALGKDFGDFVQSLYYSVSFTEHPADGCEPGYMRALGLDFPELAAMSRENKLELAAMLTESASREK